MTLRPKGIVFDADYVPALADFWSLATGYEVKSSGIRGLPTSSRKEPVLKHIFIIKVPEGKTAKNRCHIDFDTDDRVAEVARLISAGATKVADHTLDGFTWTVMQDPEGNEFCVSD